MEIATGEYRNIEELASAIRDYADIRTYADLIRAEYPGTPAEVDALVKAVKDLLCNVAIKGEGNCDPQYRNVFDALAPLIKP